MSSLKEAARRGDAIIDAMKLFFIFWSGLGCESFGIKSGENDDESIFVKDKRNPDEMLVKVVKNNKIWGFER